MVRFKNRYILGQLNWKHSNNKQSELSTSRFAKALKQLFSELCGEVGHALLAPSFQIKYWNPVTKLFIFRIARDHVDLFMQNLVLLTKLETFEAKIEILHVSGTMKLIQSAAAKKVAENIVKQNDLEAIRDIEP